MALTGGTVWEVQSGGSDTNGGGFYDRDPGTSVDYSQQTSPQLIVSDAACSGNTTLTSATGGFTAAMKGNILYLSSGPGWYEIVAYTDTNTVTLDRNGPNDSGMTCNVGGCFATPGKAAAASAQDGDKIWVKAGTYTLSTSTPGAGGPVVLTSGKRIIMEGYGTARGDLGTRPVLDAGAQTGVDLFSSNGDYNAFQTFINLEADGNSGSNNTGFLFNDFFDGAFWCKATDCLNRGFEAASGQRGKVVACIAEGCTYGFYALGAEIYCWAKDCITNGFYGANSSSSVACIASGTTSGDGFGGASYYHIWLECVAYDNSGDGFQMGEGGGVACNCVSYGNGAWGYSSWTASRHQLLVNCASGNNTSGRADSGRNWTDVGAITLSADPFENAAAGDFRPNTAAGGGALLRDAGIYPPGQTDNQDVGAVQHGDPASGDTFIPILQMNFIPTDFRALAYH